MDPLQQRLQEMLRTLEVKRSELLARQGSSHPESHGHHVRQKLLRKMDAASASLKALLEAL